MTAKITSPQTKQIEHIMADALGKTNTTKDGAQRLIGQGDDFKDNLVTLIGRFTAKVSDYALVREILGDDFISPEEIAAARDLTYTDDQLAELESTLPDRETLEWLHCNDFMLVAGPPRDMSLLDIRELERSYFHLNEAGWYSKSKEVFAYNDRVFCRWLMLRKGIVPSSTFKTWDDQEELLAGCEMVPNAAEQVWGMTVYKAVRNVYLLGNIYARTSSIGSFGKRIHVGLFNSFGLDISGYQYGSGRNILVGVASSRK